jgi:hypothetical protein
LFNTEKAASKTRFDDEQSRVNGEFDAVDAALAAYIKLDAEQTKSAKAAADEAIEKAKDIVDNQRAADQKAEAAAFATVNGTHEAYVAAQTKQYKADTEATEAWRKETEKTIKSNKAELDNEVGIIKKEISELVDDKNAAAVDSLKEIFVAQEAVAKANAIAGLNRDVSYTRSGRDISFADGAKAIVDTISFFVNGQYVDNYTVSGEEAFDGIDHCTGFQVSQEVSDLLDIEGNSAVIKASAGQFGTPVWELSTDINDAPAEEVVEEGQAVPGGHAGGSMDQPA